ncbi:MAG: hypothetical protein ACRCTY_03395 [Candidatus Adiutrix sp.]
MTAKKPLNLATLSYGELKEKAKDIDGLKEMNRFEITLAVIKAENAPTCLEAEKDNPRKIKPEIMAIKNEMAKTPKKEKQARKEMRKKIVLLKRESRKYLANI